MNLFSVFRELLEKSISLFGILVDAEGQRRLAVELEMIEAEGLAVDFIVNHRVNAICRGCSRVPTPEYGPISTWYVNYCLGIARINPLTGSRVTNRHYALSPEHSVPLFKPVPLHCRESVSTKIKEDFLKDELLYEYHHSNPGYLPMLLEEIASTRELYTPVKLRMVELSKLIERVQEEVVTNENQFGEDKKMKFNIFDVPFVAEEFYETALWNMQAAVHPRDRKKDERLKQIMIKSFMDNLNLIVDNGELQKFTPDEILEFTHLTLQAMIHAIRIYQPITQHF